MRFLNTIFIALIASILLGCADEIESKGLFTYNLEINATFAEEELSRAEFDPSDLRKVTWQAGDKIEVFVVDANGVYATGSLTTQDSGEKAYFTGPVTASEGLTPPFSITATYGAEILSTAVQGGLAQYRLGALKPTMVARDNGPIYFVNRIALTFNQVASAIHLCDIPVAVTKVTIESLGEKKISGIYSYNITTGTGSAAENITEVDVNNGSAHIGIAPGNYTDGFKLKFWNESGELQYIKLPALQVEKGYSYNISPITEFVPIKLKLSSAEAYHIDASGSRSTGGATSDVAQSSIAWGNVEFLGAPASMIEEMGIRVYDSSNNMVYTTSGTSFTAKEYGAGAYNWNSYKSHGTQYTVKAFAIVEGETYESAGTTVSYVRPAIAITKSPIDCYTSYSKYLASDISGANACDGSSIYLSGNCTFKGVTADVFKQVSGSAYLTLDGTVTYVSTVKGQNFSNTQTIADQSWSDHNITASVNFDGATTTSVAHTVQVTGIPYDATPPSNGGLHPWKSLSGDNTFNANRVELYYAASQYPAVASPEFYIPADINVDIPVRIERNDFTFIGSIHGQLSISTLNSANSTGTDIYKANLKSSEILNTTLQGTMTPTYNRWRIHYNYMATGPRTYIYYFRLKYR